MPRESVSAKVAEAIAEAINSQPGGTFAETVKAERSYADWDETLQEMDELHVDVVPAGFASIELDNRDELVYRVLTDIGVRKKFGQDNQRSATGRIDLASLDELQLLTEQLHEFFCTDRLETEPTAVWVETDVRASYLRKHLRELRQFTSIVRVTHDYTKQIGAE